MMIEDLFISVIIPTYNRQESLLACLSSLERQTHPSGAFEVIVVDDGSSDGTVEAAREFMRQSKLNLLILSKVHAGPGAARNYGAEQAKGALLAFLEDDVTAEEHWLERASREFMTKSIAGLEGVTYVQNSLDSLRAFEEVGYLSFIPCNLFIRKEVFHRVGGYDPAFFDEATNLYFREDADLGFRLLQLGCRVEKAGNVIVTHPVQFFSSRDAYRHVRRFYFDPLLHRKNPQLFRTRLETKKFWFIRVHRPFHYLCLFHLLFFLLIFAAMPLHHAATLFALALLLLIVHTGIRYRYERKLLPRLWKVMDTVRYAILPFYYLYWLVRGCRKFQNWAVLI